MAMKNAIGNVIANTKLLEMATAFGPSCVLSAAARLGVADALGDAERSASEVAKACRADASSMYRLLRAMAALGLLEETQQRRFRLTEMGRPLRKDVPDSSSAAVVFWADLLADFWSHLAECVRTGQNAQQVMDKAGIASRWSQDPRSQCDLSRGDGHGSGGGLRADRRCVAISGGRRCRRSRRRWRVADPRRAGAPSEAARHAGGQRGVHRSGGGPLQRGIYWRNAAN